MHQQQHAEEDKGKSVAKTTHETNNPESNENLFTIINVMILRSNSSNWFNKNAVYIRNVKSIDAKDAHRLRHLKRIKNQYLHEDLWPKLKAR